MLVSGTGSSVTWFGADPVWLQLVLNYVRATYGVYFNVHGSDLDGREGVAWQVYWLDCFLDGVLMA